MRALCAFGGTTPQSAFARTPQGPIHYLDLAPQHPRDPRDLQHPRDSRHRRDPDHPIVLIHGAGGGAANWYRMFAPLSRRHRVLALDLPGFGLTEARAPERPLGIQAAHLVRDWMDALQIEKATIIGTSFGGLAALRFAQHFPARTAQLALIDTAGAAAGVSPLIRTAQWPIAPLIFAPSRSGTRWLLRNVLMRRRLPGDEEAALVEYLYQSALHAEPGYFVKALRLFTDRKVQSERPSDDELQRVTSHTIVIWGTRDRFFPPDQAAKLANRLPNATHVLIDGAGHSPNWENPDELAATLNTFIA